LGQLGDFNAGLPARRWPARSRSVYIFIAGMLAFGVWSAIRKVRSQVGREAA